MKHEMEGLRGLRLALVSFLVLTILMAGASCKRKSLETSANSNASDEAEETQTSPPFSTREPERYQWRRVITGAGAADTASAGDGTVSQSVFMARDGDRRREDYEILNGVKLTVLRLPEGNFTLYPSKKIYAELSASDGAQAGEAKERVPQDFSADKLINASRTGARYERLGTEEIDGRMTTKYRITLRGQTGQTVETITWVDESLGMPIRSESTSRSDAAGETRYTVEYRDIKLEADSSLFVLPKDYKKVSQQEIQKEMLSNLPGMLGGDNEENKAGAKKR